jgi:hypothetical protein
MCTLSIIGSHANKSICDGLGCSSEATNTVEEEANNSIIVLDLCDDCLIKFREY